MFLLIYNNYFLRIIVFCLLAVIFLPANSMASSLKNQLVINDFYSSRDGDPLWVSNSKLNKSGRALLSVLKQSWENGFNPNSYNVSRISEIIDSSKRRMDESHAIEIELLLTGGFVEYIRDLSGMRINAYQMGLNPKHWRQRISAHEAISTLPQKDIAKFISSREPQTQTYKSLKAEFIRLVETTDFSNTQEKLKFKRTVRPNKKYKDIPKLRTLLGIKGEAEKVNIYDDELVDAVIKFQTEKGLKPDGLIGKQTLAALNLTDLDRINQLIVNMERLRWVEDEKPSRFVVVNIPAATLWAIEDGKVRFEMPVVVGRKKRQTPSFVTHIRGIRFNPTWTVPPTIKLEDILPKLRSDPSYLANKGIELYEGYDRNAPTLDPAVVDWNSVGKNELHGFRMVQVPGKNNPLGRIRVLMPNKHNIYLHDTNNKSLFSRVNRAKSSGCIRMKNPKKMVRFVLENRNKWSEKRMNNALSRGKTKDIYTPEKIAVYLLYYTVWLGGENQIIYGSDIYGHDKTLSRMLKKLGGILGGDNIIAKVVDN